MVSGEHQLPEGNLLWPSSRFPSAQFRVSDDLKGTPNSDQCKLQRCKPHHKVSFIYFPLKIDSSSLLLTETTHPHRPLFDHQQGEGKVIPVFFLPLYWLSKPFRSPSASRTSLPVRYTINISSSRRLGPMGCASTSSSPRTNRQEGRPPRSQTPTNTQLFHFFFFSFDEKEKKSLKMFIFFLHFFFQPPPHPRILQQPYDSMPPPRPPAGDLYKVKLKVYACACVRVCFF